jgi:hypothetical protein
MSGGYDAVRGGLGEAELSSNDAYAVTLPMHLSNFLAIDDHSRPSKGFTVLLRAFASGSKLFGCVQGAEFQFSCVVLRTLAHAKPETLIWRGFYHTRGEGLIGLTRGFMYAGSPRLIASLWPDRATSKLMKRFYKGMFRWRASAGRSLASRSAGHAQNVALVVSILPGRVQSQGEWQ